MTFDEFEGLTGFSCTLPRGKVSIHRGYREYEAVYVARTRVCVRLCDTHDETYMADVEKQAKRELWDRLRRELLDG